MIKIITKQIVDLKKYDNNARSHTLTQIENIAESIKEFGFNNPILIDENNEVIAGHGRIEASLMLHFKELPCIILHDLTEIQKRSYRLADNKIALNSTWNTDLLERELKEIMSLDQNYNMGITGFSQEEIEYMAVKEIDFDNIGNELKNEEEKSPKLCPHCNGEL